MRVADRERVPAAIPRCEAGRALDRPVIVEPDVTGVLLALGTDELVLPRFDADDRLVVLDLEAVRVPDGVEQEPDELRASPVLPVLGFQDGEVIAWNAFGTIERSSRGCLERDVILHAPEGMDRDAPGVVTVFGRRDDPLPDERTHVGHVGIEDAQGPPLADW